MIEIILYILFLIIYLIGMFYSEKKRIPWYLREETISEEEKQELLAYLDQHYSER